MGAPGAVSIRGFRFEIYPVPGGAFRPLARPCAGPCPGRLAALRATSPPRPAAPGRKARSTARCSYPCRMPQTGEFGRELRAVAIILRIL